MVSRRGGPRWLLPTVAVIVVFAMVATVVGVILATTRGSGSTAVGQARWGPCESSSQIPAELITRIECGVLTVPLSHDDPDSGRTLQIGLARLKAAGASRGSIVMNPGGPGEPGTGLIVGSARELAAQPMAEHFDLVSFDPRGIGASSPQIACRTDEERDAERAMDFGDLTDAGIERSARYLRRLGEQCAERNGAELLANIGTVSVAKDLELLRIALGDDALTYLGFSYGTLLGIRYAELFPNTVRAMVFDGAMDVSLGTDDGALSQVGGFARAFEAFAADCTTRPQCPLGTDPARTLERYQGLVRGLLEQPLTTEDGRVLTFDEADTATLSALYRSASWPVLRAALSSLAGGRADDMMRLADQYEGRRQNGIYSNSADAFLAVRCADDERAADPGVYDRIDLETRRIAPHTDDGRGTGRGLPWTCEFWPTGPEAPPPVIPVIEHALVVASTLDPATPYEEGVALAEDLDAPLLTVDSADHTSSFSGDGCVDTAVNAFLIDLVAPPTHARC